MAFQGWKSFNKTSAATGDAIWTPASGKRVAVESLQVNIYGTTAGRVVIWFGASGDTTYSEGTDMVLFKGNFIPSASVTYNLFLPYPTPVTGAIDYVLRVTTDAAVSIDIVADGYEF